MNQAKDSKRMPTIALFAFAALTLVALLPGAQADHGDPFPCTIGNTAEPVCLDHQRYGQDPTCENEQFYNAWTQAYLHPAGDVSAAFWWAEGCGSGSTYHYDYWAIGGGAHAAGIGASATLSRSTYNDHPPACHVNADANTPLGTHRHSGPCPVDVPLPPTGVPGAGAA